ncbi:hypothetical protein DA73_0400030580 [Tolypothrix bouteillei VB521301]|uniref:Uncharacterized protein n=1 Tax=Tolypothrix bouteillei VB521301 TaxID=1479485 RepID=A0A8S9TA60_9CYAN|nr:hypothetical protein DA73_0400030580 [Tolypothrix bouteillei VB521301]
MQSATTYVHFGTQYRVTNLQLGAIADDPDVTFIDLKEFGLICTLTY